MSWSVKKRRFFIWLGWPLGLSLFWLGVYLNIRAKHGGGVYWAWSASEVGRDLVMLLLPPLLLEWLFVKGRNNG